MKYTRSMGVKLLNMGFKMELNSEDIPGDDDILQYEIYAKGLIEVTVEHSPGKVIVVDLPGYTDNLKINSLDELKLLDRMIN